MTKVVNSRIRRLVARIGLLIVIVILIAGVAGCERGEYVLNILSTEGGTVTSPGEGVLTYPAGATVVLMAQPDPGYRFAGWTGDVRAIKDINSASTIIAIKGNYTITAQFEWVS